MRLPSPLYEAVKGAFSGYALWHVARYPENAPLRGARSPFPTLRALDEPGSGEQFLRHHREMLLGFRWLAARTPGHGFAIERWRALPHWLAEAFHDRLGPAFLDRAYERIDRLVRWGTADDLGTFLEATFRTADPYANLHNLALGTISDLELGSLDEDVLADADAGDPASAPHNEHFWALHGWIDGLFAEWQRRHGEDPDPPPAPPPRTHAMPAPESLGDLVGIVEIAHRRRFPSVFDGPRAWGAEARPHGDWPAPSYRAFSTRARTFSR